MIFQFYVPVPSYDNISVPATDSLFIESDKFPSKEEVLSLVENLHIDVKEELLYFNWWLQVYTSISLVDDNKWPYSWEFERGLISTDTIVEHPIFGKCSIGFSKVVPRKLNTNKGDVKQ